MSLGSKIVALRKANNLSRKELSEATNIPYPTLSNYENDTRLPTARRLKELAAFFNVDFNYLCEDTLVDGSLYLAEAARERLNNSESFDEITLENNDEAALVLTYRRADDTDRQILELISRKYVRARKGACQT